MIVLTFSLLTAYGFWFLLFFPGVAGLFPFWYLMTTACICLATIGLWASHKSGYWLPRLNLSGVLYGVLQAVLLYGIFFVGRLIFEQIWPAAPMEINQVYQTKNQLSPVVISLLLIIIGSAEEIYWRGYVQRKLMHRWGTTIGVSATLFFYTTVHLFAWNLSLLVAAFVAGLFWGLSRIYFRSIVPGIISHVLWDIAIFVWFPLS